MVFSSLFFIFGFVPVFFVAYYLAPRQSKNVVALLGSYFFYAWGAPRFAVVLLVASLLDYIISQRLVDVTHKKFWLSVSLTGNIALLAYCKYANFFVREFNDVFGAFGFGGIHWTQIALPIGISFFTFQKISYIVDVYRGTTKPAKRAVDFLLYVALFPQLIAGPIVRYHDISQELVSRTHHAVDVFEGMYRFCIGLGKKVLIANVMAETADVVFGLDASHLTSGFAWLGILAYGFQIYFDFSGYSDMAIGLGRMMGFHFLENFNSPYIAKTFSEFWQRWHISLSSFMREYLYIPLGGNRASRVRTYVNLWIVFLFSGLWHGAEWTFLLWGAYHGLFLTLDKMFWQKFSQRLPGLVNVFLTFVFVLIGWVLFRSVGLSQALIYTKTLFSFSDTTTTTFLIDLIGRRGWIVFWIAVLLSFIPYSRVYLRLAGMLSEARACIFRRCIKIVVAIFLFSLSVLSLANASFNPFIYFRF